MIRWCRCWWIASPPARTQFRDRVNYQNNLAAARNVIDAQQPSEWDENLYMGWLATLRELSKPTTDAKYPEVLRTQAWAMKSLNTQLASWTQLRHDTILYAKQSYTSGADLLLSGRLRRTGAARLEPHGKDGAAGGRADRKNAVPERHVHQENSAGDVQIDFKTLQKKQAAFLHNFAKQVGTLKTIAGKQLEQKELTAAETKFLKDVVQKDSRQRPHRVQRLVYEAVLEEHDDSGQPDRAGGRRAYRRAGQYHGDPGCVLHQGVGNVDLLLIAIDNGKDRMVYAGPVLSHYEFEMTGDRSQVGFRMAQGPPRRPSCRRGRSGRRIPGAEGNARSLECHRGTTATGEAHSGPHYRRLARRDSL